ncbi:cytochrome c oxidase subunit I [Roseisolibacter sp. H3M3-2]|uniref:cytochrome c oxidase subunit I n=1 Tax=Roseisolibacter sp. H3M3-2 TaxID=3031323 RepID=UPI0023D9A7EE|nr:cytochrome c oxidase subunit I [Roseisolibacter sp. H3M3-2]MDF1504878.1 cytochrome c oxidase subunit I [Roseisolibacter sp. H3M3-2]
MADDAAAERRKREFEETWDAPKGLLGVFQVIDNIPIAVRYMATSFAFFLIGGALALVMRLQLARPDGTVLDAQTYNEFFTMHGTTMMFLFVIPFLEAFANYLIPLLNGTRDLPFPRLTALSYWTYLFGGIYIYSSFLFGAAPDGGWFAYVPLNLKQYSPGHNMDFWDIGLSVAEVAAIGAAAEMIVGILRMRAPGMSLNRMPLFCWALLVTSVMIVFAFTPLIVGTAMLELDRKEMTRFFDARYGGDPLLWQHIFWVFGHPEVYIMFVPAVGVLTHVVQTFARRPVTSYTLMVLALLATAFISFGLWVHHMFTTGLSPVGMGFFAAASMLIAIPNGIQLFGWITTLWAGRPRWRTPLLFGVGGVVIFLLGGITGVMVAAVPFDWQVHDTFFVVAHFHYVLIGGVLFPIFAGLYYWIPKFSGHLLGERLGRWNFWTMFVGFNVAFFPMHLSGLRGMPRRVYSYPTGLGLDVLNLVSTVGAGIFAVGVLLFLVNFARSVRGGAPAGRDPWEGDTLEWSEASPPENAQFARIPVVRSRHPMWEQETLLPVPEDDADVADAARQLDHAPSRWRGSLVVGVLDGRPLALAHLPRKSPWPFVMSVGFTIVFVAALVEIGWVFWVGAAVTLVALAGWFWPLDTERVAIDELYAARGEGARGGQATVPADAPAPAAPGPVRLPLPVGDRSSNGYWGTWVLLAIIFVSLGTLVASYVYLGAGPSPVPAA